ncbi:LAFA_0F16446g1_1 [Lachancea sp. 'fantastica']|nr:LAFA_0F16446g1_1 [Lachancea sp. 'fantastica']
MNRSRLLLPLRTLTSKRSLNGKPQLNINGIAYDTHPDFTNVSSTILNLSDRSQHLKSAHPIGILRKQIEDKLNSTSNSYQLYNDFRPVVTVEENFDSLGFPPDHPGRSRSDTYYVNDKHLFRTHTSAHELECFGNIQGFSPKTTTKTSTEKPGFLITADVYRRDEIDRTHYPVFHQMEGARVWKRSFDKLSEGHEPLHIQQIRDDLRKLEKQLREESSNLVVEDEKNLEGNPKQEYMSDLEVDLCSQHLKRTIELLVAQVFNKRLQSIDCKDKKDAQLQVRWIKAYFPWTAPSWEIEVFWKGEWLELCGCGLVREQVLLNTGYKKDSTIGWAFGLGLDRIAMLLFEIPDIRLFWTHDDRFHSQFREGQITRFQPYSKYPGTTRDVAFWLPEQKEASVIHENDIMEIVREEAGDMVESVKLIDQFTHPKNNKKSVCYRINYQSMDRNLTNEEINKIQENVRSQLVQNYKVTLR